MCAVRPVVINPINLPARDEQWTNYQAAAGQCGAQWASGDQAGNQSAGRTWDGEFNDSLQWC